MSRSLNLFGLSSTAFGQVLEMIKTNGCRNFFLILSNYEIQYPNLCELIVILAISPSTGPLERSYSKLAKICFKDRNRISDVNLETLYLLAVLEIDEEDFFPQVRKLLERIS